MKYYTEPIIFSSEVQLGVELPHDDMLFIVLNVFEVEIRRVLVNTEDS